MRDWPTFKITGGPHAKNMEITRDGEPMRGLHRGEITFDVNDVVRMTFYTFVQTGEIEVKGETKFVAYIYAPEPPGEGFRIIGEESHYKRTPMWTGVGDSMLEALDNLVKEVRDASSTE